VGADGKVLDKDHSESSPYQKDSSITDLLTALLFSLLIDQFICIFHTIPTTCGAFGEPFSAYEPDEEIKRDSIKILKEIKQNPDSSESSDSEGVDALSRASIREQEEKYGETIEDYHSAARTNSQKSQSVIVNEIMNLNGSISSENSHE